MAKITRCTSKTNGGEYFCRTRSDWGVRKFSVDPDTTGWHPSSKAARCAAEAGGWIWVRNRRGNLMLVNQSAAHYYVHVES